MSKRINPELDYTNLTKEKRFGSVESLLLAGKREYRMFWSGPLVECGGAQGKPIETIRLVKWKI